MKTPYYNTLHYNNLNLSVNNHARIKFGEKSTIDGGRLKLIVCRLQFLLPLHQQCIAIV